MEFDKYKPSDQPEQTPYRRPQTPDEAAQAFGIPDEARDNPLIQAFLERRSGRAEATPEPQSPQAYQPSEPLRPEHSAAILNIPEEHLSHPAVAELVSVHSRLDQLVTDTLRAHTDHDRPAKGMTLARERELLNAPDMKLSLEDRYHVANALLLAAQEFLTEGTGIVPSSPEPYAFRKLRDALDRVGYDLHLTKQPPTVYNFDDGLDPIEPEAGLDE